MSTSSFDYGISLLANKREATPEELAMYRPISHGRFEIEVEGRVFRLDREDEHDHLDAYEQALAETDNPLWDVKAKAPVKDPACPNKVDHRPQQTPVKDQGDRGTCVCFASLSCLEALFKRDKKKKILSEQYANWLFMLQEGRNQCDDGLRATRAALHLSKFGVCLEKESPYEDRATVFTHCMAAPPSKTQQKAIYGIGKFAIINRLGLFGPSIANPDYLEALLCKGYDIVFGMNVAWGRPDDGIHNVILDSYGNPKSSGGGHAMLMVGYDRTGPIPYFIAKNSWGANVGHSGYYYFSYDYIRMYAKYGYIVYNIREDMSDIPSDTSGK